MSTLNFTNAEFAWYDPGTYQARDFLLIADDMVLLVCTDTPALRYFTAKDTPFGNSPIDVPMRIKDSPGNEAATLLYDSVRNKIWALTGSPATRLLMFDADTYTIEKRYFACSVVTYLGKTYACCQFHTSTQDNYPGNPGEADGDTWEYISDDICDSNTVGWATGNTYVAGEATGTQLLWIDGDWIFMALHNPLFPAIGYMNINNQDEYYNYVRFLESSFPSGVYVVGSSLFQITNHTIFKCTLDTDIPSNNYEPVAQLLKSSEGLIGFFSGHYIYDGKLFVTDNSIIQIDPATFTIVKRSNEMDTAAGKIGPVFDSWVAVSAEDLYIVNHVNGEVELDAPYTGAPGIIIIDESPLWFDGTYIYGKRSWFYYRYGPITLDVPENPTLDATYMWDVDVEDIDLVSTYMWDLEEPSDNGGGGEGGTSSSTRAFVWNEETNSFVIHDVDFLCHRDVLYTKIPYDLLGDSAGQILRFDDGFNTVAGLPIYGVIETADMTFDIPDQMKRISEVIPELKIQDQISELMIQVGVRNRLQDDLKWSDPVPFTIGVSERCDFNGFRKEGKYIRLRFYSDQLTSPWKMSGYTIKYEIAGTR